MKNKQSFNDLKYYSACCRCQYYIDNSCVNRNDCVWLDIEKELKALEIIKKYINVGCPYGTAKYIYLNDENELISEEEYDLLKEVLC